MNGKQEVLKKYFGYDAFRGGQAEVIDALLAGQDVVSVMPTGAGKSLCYQIPAMLLPGVTLVVSPLISLMADQVLALNQAGISAAYINSSLSAAQMYKALDYAAEGRYKIIYVAPERLLTDAFWEFAQHATIPLISVDEAHCVSQWGQDFRPGYLRIAEFIGRLPTRPIVGAFTATATRQVRDDIVSFLNLRQPKLVSTGFDRKNLFFSMQKPKNKFAALVSFLKEHKDQSGIVYCLTRKSVEETCQRLLDLDYSATRYHAGLPDHERQTNQNLFQADDRRIMVATNAFGMGIDKSNVSFVVHYNMPKNMESYYQEAGRAGRDGSPAECLLLYGGQDVITNQFFIDKAFENDEMSPEMQREFKEHEKERLKRMTFYCHTSDCLRRYILRYFGEDAPNNCGFCSQCTGSLQREDITVAAQKMLSCAKRMGETCEEESLISVLRGESSPHLEEQGFLQLSTFGIMSEYTSEKLQELIAFLREQRMLLSDSRDFKSLVVGEKAREILFGSQKLYTSVVQPKQARKEEPSIPTKRGAPSAGPEDMGLFRKLQALRKQIADAQSVPAFVVFTDATLHEMCRVKPKNTLDMSYISGVGEAKLRKYGEAFLKEIRAHQ